MGSSPGFSSLAPDWFALFGLAFAAAPPLKGLTLGRARELAGSLCKSHAVSRTPRDHRPPTARRHGVSGSVSSPDRGSSHRSVALLGSLSVVIAYLALREGPRRFRPGFTCPTLLGYRSGGRPDRPTGLSPALAPRSSGLRLPHDLDHSHASGPTTPPGVPGGLGCSPFARRY